MKNEKVKAYVLIDLITILILILASMTEYAIGVLTNYHYPNWAIYPAAIRGASFQAACLYYLNQPWYIATIVVEIAVALWLAPKIIYPALCKIHGVEK